MLNAPYHCHLTPNALFMNLTVFGKENRDYTADIVIVQIVGSVNMDDSRWLYP